MGEQTQFRLVDLPEGTDCVFYADVNVVGLARRLSPAERIRAVEDLVARWRRDHLRLIPAA